MKITDLDKRRAIKRLPEFKKDHARHKKLKTEDKITQFKIDFLKKWGYEFEKIHYADDVAKHRRDTPTVEAVERITDAPYIIFYQGEEKTSINLTGDSLYLKATLEGKTETQLMEDFRDAIKPYLNFIKANSPKKRNKKIHTVKDELPFIEDIWPVYDLYIKTHKDEVETTRRLYSLSGTPSGSYPDSPGHFDQKYQKRVHTAIKNAEAIIAWVRKEHYLK